MAKYFCLGCNDIVKHSHDLVCNNCGEDMIEVYNEDDLVNPVNFHLDVEFNYISDMRRDYKICNCEDYPCCGH